MEILVWSLPRKSCSGFSYSIEVGVNTPAPPCCSYIVLSVSSESIGRFHGVPQTALQRLSREQPLMVRCALL